MVGLRNRSAQFSALGNASRLGSRAADSGHASPVLALCAISQSPLDIGFFMQPPCSLIRSLIQTLCLRGLCRVVSCLSVCCVEAWICWRVSVMMCLANRMMRNRRAHRRVIRNREMHWANSWTGQMRLNLSSMHMPTSRPTPRLPRRRLTHPWPRISSPIELVRRRPPILIHIRTTIPRPTPMATPRMIRVSTNIHTTPASVTRPHRTSPPHRYRPRHRRFILQHLFIRHLWRPHLHCLGPRV